MISDSHTILRPYRYGTGGRQKEEIRSDRSFDIGLETALSTIEFTMQRGFILKGTYLLIQLLKNFFNRRYFFVDGHECKVSGF